MKKILIILTDGVEETEFIAVGDVLRRMEFDVTVAGLNHLEVESSHSFLLKAECLFAECFDTAAFDALFLPGGMGSALAFYNSPEVIAFAQDMAKKGKVVSAICAAPMALAKAGLLEDKRFTMYPGLDQYLPEHCRPTGNLAERDGNIVTGKGPGAVFAFAAELAAALNADTTETYRKMFVSI